MEGNMLEPVHWYKKWWGILIIFFLTLFLIFFVLSAFYVYRQVKYIQSGGNLSGITEDSNKIYNAEGNGTNYWYGASDPKVTIVNFADFSCSNCKSFNNKLRKASIKYHDSLKVIFRDFPVISDKSIDLAMAGRCAGEQGLFWLMHDALFENQGLTTNEEIYALAKKIGANLNLFDSCFVNEKYKILIQKDLSDGLSFDITGTPTWFINGHKIQGDAPEDGFFELIESLIKE